MFWQPESVMAVGEVVFEASALNRRTKQSPSCTMPFGSGVTPMVPVAWSHEVTRPLKYGVAVSGLPIMEMMRPTGVKLALLDGGAPFRLPQTNTPAETLSTVAPIIPPWIRCFAFSRTLLTYGDGSAKVERRSGPVKVMVSGV